MLRWYPVSPNRDDVDEMSGSTATTPQKVCGAYLTVGRLTFVISLIVIIAECRDVIALNTTMENDNVKQHRNHW